jgi:hypothetical protein
VELVRLYSNPHSAAMRLCQLRRYALSQARSCPERSLVPQRVDRRLGPELIERVVSEYAGGMSTTPAGNASRHRQGGRFCGFKGGWGRHP